MEKVTLYSYSKVWKLEKKIYAIQNLTLPVPVNPYAALYFVFAAGLIMLLGGLIPVIESIPVVIRYIAIPGGIATFILRKKLDGKNPIKYFIGYIKFIFLEKGKYIERFTTYQEKKHKVVLAWDCSRGNK